MLHTVANLKYSVAGLLSGMDLSNVDDLNGCLERAASTLVQKADIPEASGIQNITLYSGVFDYSCDSRIFGTAINDIRPQGISRSPNDFVSKVDQEDFDRTKNYYYQSGTMSTFQFQNGQPIIRIKAPFPAQQVILSHMSEVNGWSASGTASSLVQDNTNFYESPASLRFNLTTGTGILTNTFSNSFSMSNYENTGVAFLAIQIPSGATASNLTNISLKLGSDSSNYDSVTSTQGFLGAWVANDWLLVAFDFSSSTSTGTPNWGTIQYAQISLTVAGAFTNFHVGGLFMSLPSPAQILYQSAAIFLATGTTTTTIAITADTDTITLTDAAYNIYLQESALSVLQNTGAGESDATSIKINSMLNGSANDIGLYARYRGDNPSQEIRTSGSWYDTNLPYNSW